MNVDVHIGLLDLDDGCLVNIFGRLDPLPHLFRVSAVCKVCAECFWKPLCDPHWYGQPNHHWVRQQSPVTRILGNLTSQCALCPLCEAIQCFKPFAWPAYGKCKSPCTLRDRLKHLFRAIDICIVCLCCSASGACLQMGGCGSELEAVATPASTDLLKGTGKLHTTAYKAQSSLAGDEHWKL